MRQWRWLELIKGYNLKILYHPGKANLVADALSHKRHMSIAATLMKQKELIEDLRWLEVEVLLGDVEARLASFRLQPTLQSQMFPGEVGGL